MIRHFRLVQGFALIACGIAVASACGEEKVSGKNADGSGGSGDETSSGGSDEGPGSGGTPGSGAVSSGGALLSGGEGGSGTAGPTDMFTVPEDGGTFEFVGASGNPISFEFPASAAGEDITFASGSPEDIGWPAGKFSDVILLGPSGLTFDPPIVVRPSSKDIMLLTFEEGGEQGPAEGLELNDDGDGLLLPHFTALAVVPPGKSCDSTSGWQVEEGSADCDDADYPDKITFTCKGYSFCTIIDAQCCAAPGSTACDLDAGNCVGASITYTRTDSNGGQYTYCDADQGAGGAGGGSGAGGSGDSGGAGGGSAGPLSCFGGSDDTFTGNGQCGTPFSFNMQGDAPGTVRTNTASNLSADNYWSGDATCATGSTREDIYLINPYIGWSSIDVSVDAVNNEDVSITFLGSDNGCSTGTEVLCTNDGTWGECEVSSATFAQLQTNAITVIISSDFVAHPITAHFRVN